MTSPGTLAPTAPAIDPQALRIVLFGMPDAGKSSLLGALAQAAQTQERALQGRLSDPWQGLAELQRRVYDEKPRETLDEIVPYPIAYEPFKAQKPDPTQRLDAVFYDCDGRIANEILTRQTDLGGAAAGQLANTILKADSLLLVVDAAAPPEQIESDFGEFIRFLRFFEQQRGQRSEVGGLPVYLVLSKCDKLLHPGEPVSAWSERIEAKKKEVHARFKEFVEADQGPVGFGSIDLEVAATAVRRPGAGGAARDPLGVAELFRNCLGAARDYRDRVRKSQRRLTITIAGAAAVILALAGAAAGLYFTHEVKPPALADAIEGFRANEGNTAADRLAEPLPRKISQLSGMQQNPEFEKLSPELKEYTNQRLLEMTAYRKFRDQLFEVRPPADLRSLEELRQLEARLKERYDTPREYADEWRSTDAVLLREKWLADLAAIRVAANDMANWYSQLRADAGRLLYLSDKPGERSALPWPIWHEQLGRLLAQAEAPPHRPTDRLPNTGANPSAKQTLTYETVFALAEVSRSRQEWEDDRQKLVALRDVTQALGLAGGSNERRAILKLPESVGGDDVRERLATLKKEYPNAGEWTVARLPDAVSPDIRAAAAASYSRLVEQGRGVVPKALQRRAADGLETHARWLEVADWLPDAAELRDWRELALVLLRLIRPQADDPVAALTAFLKERSFNLKFAGLQLTIPDDAAPQRLRPNGNLTLFLRAGEASTTLSFAPRGEGNREPLGRSATYAFAPEGADRLTFAPGSQLWAELNLRDESGKNWKLTWLECRSYQVYSFERLSQSPHLHAADEKDPRKGTLPKDMILTVTPRDGVPRVPDLLPFVKLK